MAYELPYRAAVEKKAYTLFTRTTNCTVMHSYAEDEGTLEITLSYNGFKAVMYYCQNESADYSFLENEHNDKCLITKFKFDYSDFIYSIYDVHNAVEDKKFDTYVFHCLYNEEQVLGAIDIVIAFINRNYNILCSINSNTQLQQKLDASFDNGLLLASRKITRQMLKENPKKYYKKHSFNMYLYRSSENPFTSHINKGNKGEIQRFFTRESKHNHLLIFEERYLEYLFENDFNVPENDIIERIHKQEKTSGFLKRTETITTIVSLILSISYYIFLAVICEKRIEKNYYLLNDVEIDSFIPIALILMGLFAILYFPIEKLLMKKKDGYDTNETKNNKKSIAVIALFGIIVISLTSLYMYFDLQKAVGINDNEIYYCQHLGKTEHLSYDDVDFYLIEGTYIDDAYRNTFEDKKIVVVKDDEYFYSDDMEYLNVPKTFVDSLPFEATYKDMEEFEKAHQR